MPGEAPEEKGEFVTEAQLQQFKESIEAETAARYEQEMERLRGAPRHDRKGAWIARKDSGIDEVVEAILKKFPLTTREEISDLLWGFLNPIHALANLDAKDIRAHRYRWMYFRLNFIQSLASVENRFAEMSGVPVVKYDNEIEILLDNVENWVFLQLTRAKGGKLQEELLTTVHVEKQSFGSETQQPQQPPQGFFGRIMSRR